MNIRNFFKLKRIIWTVIFLAVVGGIVAKIMSSKSQSGSLVTDNVKKMTLKQTVLATGELTSETDLNLSFKSSGIVRKVAVKVNDKIKAGALIANLEQKDQQAALTSARGALASAQANYQRVLDGASSEEVQVAQKAVDAAQVTLDNAKQTLENTKAQQKVLVDNAYSAMLNAGLTAVPATSNTNTLSPTVSGTYTGSAEGTYAIKELGKYYYVTGLEIAGDVAYSSTAPTPLGTKGLYLTFPTNTVISSDSWTVEIPNKNSPSYLTYYNAYKSAQETQNASVSTAQASVNSSQAALDSAKAALDLKKAQARPADIKAAQAQVLSAQGQVEAAQSALENTIIRAPVEGTITKSEIKVGELATALTPYFTIQDVGNLHLQANVSEANIAVIRPGQSVEVTFDALNSDRKFYGQIEEVDPASTVVSGVVNYKIKSSIENSPDIKPGMTANMTIMAVEKQDVLAVATRAIIINDSGKFVRIVTDLKKKQYQETPVTIGLNADDGLTEILSGLTEGQQIVTFINKK